ncbi:GGDEF domain-containing protein [Actinophytocola xanthii]|uniref:GGDEF domain-containing protein n=1 Tax=Actinophytocola xanthii TaxID=1912961 RepID=UPI0009FB1E45|nr:GGDEF domain-containing protein [Actinophytocola xanthii]
MTAAALALTMTLGLRSAIEPHALMVAGVLLAMGVAETEMARTVERDRREYNDTPHVNLTAVWTVPGAIVLPPVLAAVVVVALYLHLYWRSWFKVRRVPAYRPTLSAMVALLSCYTTWGVVQLLAPAGRTSWDQLELLGVLVIALVARFMVNSLVIGAAISLFERRFDPRRAIGTWHDNALELGTLGLGALSAAALLIGLHPASMMLAVPVVLVLHRNVLIRQLEEAASTDPKTGLANAVAWTAMAAAEVDRSEGAGVGVLMVDLDNFKAVNDRHGHLPGDQVLKAVAKVLTSAVRPEDVVGRWGGEEFVVVCPAVSTEELVQVGERICDEIRRLEVAVSGHTVISGLTASVGAAIYPLFGPDLRDVLLAADDALFVAKDSGKNQVSTIEAHG